MASKAVNDAVVARLNSVWPGITAGVSALYPQLHAGIPFFAPNADVSQVPRDGSPFLIVEFPVGSEEQITIGAPGNNSFREIGAVRFVLQVRVGTGLDPWSGYMDSLRAQFRGKQFGGVNTWAASPPVIDDQTDEGSAYEFAFSVPYYFDLFA